MVDNQHKKIAGYRDLSEAEIALINHLKELEDKLGDAVIQVQAMAATDGHGPAGRWAAMARSNLETGMMYAIKAVARPENGLGVLLKPD